MAKRDLEDLSDGKRGVYKSLSMVSEDLKPIRDSLPYKRTRVLQTSELEFWPGVGGWGGGGGGGVVFAPVWPAKNISLLCLDG